MTATELGRVEAARAEAIMTSPPPQMLELSAEELDALGRIVAKLDG